MDNQLKTSIIMLRQENAALKNQNNEMQFLCSEMDKLSKSFIIGWEELKLFLKTTNKECRNIKINFDDTFKFELSDENKKLLKENITININNIISQIFDIINIKIENIENKDNIIKKEEKKIII